VLFTAIVRLPILCGIALAGVCFAQPEYEIGGLFGYGLYRDVRVNGAGAEATAGIRNRFVAGAVVCEDLYEHISGEVRYLYHDGDPFLSAGGVRGNIQGQSHTFSYDLLFHVRPRDERFRPYVAAGAGAKYYRTTGPAPEPQPVPQIASLIHTSDWKLAIDLGVGVKYRWRRNVVVRAEFRDYITPFPKKIFVPAANGTDRGLFQQFTPMVGVSYSF